MRDEAGTPDRRIERTRARWVAAALLLLLTAVVAGAARWKTPGAVGGNGTDLGLHRHAPTHSALRFEGRLDRSAVRVGGDGRVHLELVATGSETGGDGATRRPTDLVVVLDRSGSMNGQPLAEALAAIRELVDQLEPEDRFALVTYANQSTLTLPLEAAEPEARARWLSELERVTAGGGTHMSAGLDRAHALIDARRRPDRVARMLLLSDGHANQGDATPDGLARRAGRALSAEYVLSTVGVGQGFDERLMTRLADAGTGNFYYVPRIESLAGVFADEFAAARETVARALEIHIETPDGVEVLDAAGYPIERDASGARIRPGSLFEGQRRSLWVTLRVPSSMPTKTALGRVSLAYRSVDGARHEARLDPFPAVEAVADEATFVASLDAEAVERQHAVDLVNRMRQEIASFVGRGDYDAARASLDDVDYGDLEALGYAPEETESFEAVRELKKAVERAASAPAARQSEVRNQLGKSLYEAGTDGRRAGAKR